MVRKHETVKDAPAVNLAIIKQRWTFDNVVEMVERHLEEKANAEFEAAFESKFNTKPKTARTYELKNPKTPWYLDPESGGPNPPADQRKPGVSYRGESDSL